MAGDGYGINVDSLRTANTGYYKAQSGSFCTGYLVPVDNSDSTRGVDVGQILRDFSSRYGTPRTSDLPHTGYDMIVDKNGVVRKGKIVTTQPVEWKDGLLDADRKPLDKVKKEQVEKFLTSIASLGLDLKAEDIMTKDGTLNPNFKIDEKGNICFRNVKKFINGEVPTYFETQNGQWAEEEPKQKFNPLAQNPYERDSDISRKKRSQFPDWLNIRRGDSADNIKDVINKFRQEHPFELYKGDSVVA